MKKPVISGWVLSFGSEKALLQAVRVLVKEENLRRCKIVDEYHLGEFGVKGQG